MKNGTAMISNRSMPVNSLRATDWIGTSVRVNRKVSTVSPSAIEIGIPVSISAIRSPKTMNARTPCGRTMNPVVCARQIAKINIGARIRISPRGLPLRVLAGSGATGWNGSATASPVVAPGTVGSNVCGTPSTWAAS